MNLFFLKCSHIFALHRKKGNNSNDLNQVITATTSEWISSNTIKEVLAINQKKELNLMYNERMFNSTLFCHTSFFFVSDKTNKLLFYTKQNKNNGILFNVSISVKENKVQTSANCCSVLFLPHELLWCTISFIVSYMSYEDLVQLRHLKLIQFM